ncbi:hypothetical protein HZ326_31621 [Fusarium oxysporum f. sp. albedinis]|nr:hypothetical protein HZ326_31621 [Fusarium oxysporum f. sp. albedinis]
MWRELVAWIALATLVVQPQPIDILVTKAETSSFEAEVSAELNSSIKSSISSKSSKSMTQFISSKQVHTMHFKPSRYHRIAPPC